MTDHCRYLLEKAGVSYPVIGFYDTPAPESFQPLVRPAEDKWACLFMFFNSWRKGESLHLTAENYGCGGLGTYLLDQQTRSRSNYIDFLHGEEGLKASPEIMGEWIDDTPHYQPEHEHLILGPLQPEREQALKTVTFFINPDQLSLFVTGATYHQGPNQPPLVTAPFASGCGLIAPLFPDLDRPGAIIGGTDIAMRKYLPPDILAFTVTRPTYQQLCGLDEDSFLGKPFWQEVQEKRNRS